VHEAIAELPEEYRAVVVLRDIEGLSYDEVGRATSSSRAAIKSRLHRARERLAELLADLR
jgi:RNA polymerase sigma-70 factor (ECF subfamily)